MRLMNITLWKQAQADNAQGRKIRAILRANRTTRAQAAQMEPVIIDGQQVVSRIKRVPRYKKGGRS